MKVIVNGRFLQQPRTGVQNYAYGILTSLLKSGTAIEVLTPPAKDLKLNFAVKPMGFSGGLLWEQFFLPQYVRKQKNALLLNLCNTAPLFVQKKAVTIHDLAFEESTKWFTRRFRKWYKYLIPRICKNSKIIFTVSDFSKKELIKYYHLPAEKIIVVPPGMPEMSFDIASALKGNYVLLTGANNPRKNAMWVIKNIDILEKNNLKLVLLENGSDVFNNVPLKNKESIIRLKNVSSSTYFSLLKNAKALLYPSVYEGFGIPILECLALGVPVVASNIAVFKESFGDIPLYFELDDIGSYTKAIEGIKEKSISQEDIAMLKSKYNYDLSSKLILKTIQALN